MITIPFIIGVGIVFSDGSRYGWLMAGGSLHALVVGANAGVGYSFEGMSAFELIVILVLLFGGIGLAISAVRPTTSSGG